MMRLQRHGFLTRVPTQAKCPASVAPTASKTGSSVIDPDIGFALEDDLERMRHMEVNEPDGNPASG